MCLIFSWSKAVQLVNGLVFECHSKTERICSVFKCFKPFYIGRFLKVQTIQKLTIIIILNFKMFAIQICSVYKCLEFKPPLDHLLYCF